MVKVALVVSIIALAVCLLTALHGVLSDGLKGLKQRSKPIGISFLIFPPKKEKSSARRARALTKERLSGLL